MRRLAIALMLAAALPVGCARRPDSSSAGTLAQLHKVSPDLQEATVEQGLEQAMEGYRRFLEETPEAEMTPEAMRRLADLQLERQFGLRAADGKPRGMAAPEPAAAPALSAAPDTAAAFLDEPLESDQEFERRTTAESGILTGPADFSSPDGVPQGGVAPEGPLEAIALYDKLLAEYPSYENNDKVLYQKARAYDELGRTEEAMQTMERLIRANRYSAHFDEVQFRRGEYFFTRRRYRDAEEAYGSIISLGNGTSYYELARYKLGWTFYKQELYEEALHEYMALLDYKVSIGYDFDQTHEEDDERRVTDAYRAISLSFSNVGGPESVAEYFARFGTRSYEDRVYSNLGEHYLAKLRYDDAAKTYQAFVALYPFHRAAPQFSMRVVDTFTRGGFPKLVLESKREYATSYGVRAEYWRHFTPEERPEILADLKANLNDLATHYHAQYQSAEETEDKLAHYVEARRWYGDYLDSFPADADSPALNHRYADLLLEHEDFGEAARQYEHTAYGYEAHDRSADAGYAAVYAYRRQLEGASANARDAAQRDTVASSLRFADAFPEHEHAASILGAAADDMYEMQEHGAAIDTARRVIADYPQADPATRRSAWIVTAHGSLELAAYAEAELAYSEVLRLTPQDDESYPGLVDNLAAAIYKQGELATEAQDYRAAAEHFLRIRAAAPTSAIRPTAEYDAGAALIRLQDWSAAAAVLDAFRSAYPEHELALEATRQIANAYRENAQPSQAAFEYERLGSESGDPELRREALRVAGELHEESGAPRRALEVYLGYVEEFPSPVEAALETRFKIAEIYRADQDEAPFLQQLTEIVRIDGEAGGERTGRTRTLAARSALVLAERLYQEFVGVKLRQPFEVSLADKKQRMDATVEAMNRLVEYEIGEVTAAATYYMAETYLDFSRSLLESERPADLEPAALDEYDLVLEEEAFPFEEKAIVVHEKNLELLQTGLFVAWTEKSLDRLAELVPGRYAKNEMSGGFLGAIDAYVYRMPTSQVYGPTLSHAEAATDESLQTTKLGPPASPGPQPEPSALSDARPRVEEP